MHWRKSMSERAGLRGLSTDAPASGADTHADSNSISSQSVLHLQDISNPPLNVFEFLRDAILGGVAAVAIVVSVFILLFVKT